MKLLYLSIAILLLCGRLQAQVDSSSFLGRIDTLCDCKPSLPIEIGITSALWGLPTYTILRGSYDQDSNGYKFKNMLLLPSWFLLMPVLGYTAELTSGCEASHWHALWIGASTSLVSMVLYGAFYGFEHGEVRETYHPFNVVDYLALGVLPSVASVLIFNLFLDCPEKEKTDTGLFNGYLMPFYSDNTYGISYSVKF
jgi:hypothetical protein